MKYHELKNVYFSPTGSTRKVIMATAKNIGLKSISYDLSVHKVKKPLMHFQANDFVLFGAPVYGGRIPATFLDYFDQLKGEQTPAAILVTYGCREFEDALLELKNEVEKRGFHVVSAAAFPVEHSIVRNIGMSRPDKEDYKIIDEFGIRLNKMLKKESLEDIHINVPGNSSYKSYDGIPLKPKTDKVLCTECKACAKVCPAGAISPDNPRKTDTKKCISCMKCIRQCPKKARSISTLKMSIIKKKLHKLCNSQKQAEFFWD